MSYLGITICPDAHSADARFIHLDRCNLVTSTNIEPWNQGSLDIYTRAGSRKPNLGILEIEYIIDR